MDFVSKLKTDITAHDRMHSLFLVYFFVFTMALLGYALKNPIHNWDLIAYVGSVKSFETDDKQLISDYAYSELRAYADDETYERLTASSAYRTTLYADPESFHQVLPWFQIRPIYTGLMYGLNTLGVNIFTAGHLISALSVFAGLWVFYVAFKPYVSTSLWFSAPFFVMMNGVVEVARLGTPDALAFLYTAVLTLLFLRGKRQLLWLLPLSIFIRTDMIFFVGLMLGYLFLRQRDYRIATAVSLLATVAIYLAVNRYFGNYGWATVFYLVFITDMHLNYPADTDIQISLAQYVNSVMSGIMDILVNDGFDAFAGLFAIHLGLSLRLNGLKNTFFDFFTRHVNALAVISVIYVIVHFLVFPAGYSRFFAAQYFTVLLTTLAMMTHLTANRSTE
ncbi:MAG TPA: hypothetical protein DD979_03770 [Gammaproteobacteria bacterium]|nr:hypothetical protein [Gammaproteobacteria bacterium]